MSTSNAVRSPSTSRLRWIAALAFGVLIAGYQGVPSWGHPASGVTVQAITPGGGGGHGGLPPCQKRSQDKLPGP